MSATGERSRGTEPAAPRTVPDSLWFNHVVACDAKSSGVSLGVARDRLAKIRESLPAFYRTLSEFYPFEVPLRDGTIGYHIRQPRTDDCFAAALATALQIPIHKVPDPLIDERLAAGETAEEINRSALEELAHWLHSRHLRMVIHRVLPVRRRRWIGVVPFPGDFMSHCLVLTQTEVLFDPAAEPGVREWTFADVEFGLSFQSLGQARSNSQ